MNTSTEKPKLTIKDFKSEQKSTWCPGCGDFGILSAVQMALVGADIAPWEVLLVSGIGCGSKLPDYIHANGYMTLHGRAVSVASGAHVANTDLKVIAVTGDGDGTGMGMSHFVHNIRRNIDIVHIIENNEVYALTKGQYSPTTKTGSITSTSPEGALEYPVNPGAIALAAGATFIAYGYSGDPKFTAKLIEEGMKHEGYALINILQTCPSYNKKQDPAWYKENSFKVDEVIEGYDSSDMMQAFDLLNGTHPAWQEEGAKGKVYPQGIIYQAQNIRPSYAEQIPALKNNKLPLIKHSLEVDKGKFEKVKLSYV